MKHLLSALTAISLFWIAPAGAQDKLTIMLDWFVNPDHAPLIVAQEKGYFKSTGLKVKMIAPAEHNKGSRITWNIAHPHGARGCQWRILWSPPEVGRAEPRPLLFSGRTLLPS